MKLFSKYSIFLVSAILSWLAGLVLYIHFQSTQTQFITIGSGQINLWFSALFSFFLLSNFIFIDRVIRKIEKWDVIELLWKLLVVGVVGISVTFLFMIAESYLRDFSINRFFRPIYQFVVIYAATVFLISAVLILKKFILYQKNKRKVVFWRIFEIYLLISFLAMILLPRISVLLRMQQAEGFLFYYYVSQFLIFLGISVTLSANVNWTAYLNFKQKLKSLFLTLVILLIFTAFFEVFPVSIFPMDIDAPLKGLAGFFYSNYGLIAVMSFFPIIYLLFSGLVLLFNLPTSSVFEQRSSEIASFQRINESIQRNLDFKDILKTLLDASMLTSNSQAGWVETVNPEMPDAEPLIQERKIIEAEEILELKQGYNITEKVLRDGTHFHVKNLRKHKAFKDSRLPYKSLLAIPIITRNKAIGAIYLVKDLSHSYEEESIVSLVAFADQAAIAVENSELIRESIRFERYREQIKIAREVQEQILPNELPENGRVKFYAVCQDAEEIGGDYYDFVRTGNQYKVAIGDVSGKGTTAAFYMAETKGIFQALARLDLDLKETVVKANEALSACLNPGTYITFSLIGIDLDENTFSILRAGHCPALYYHAETDRFSYLENGSLGLGIIRNGSFRDMVNEPETFRFGSGDLLILYTDGIVEARNQHNEEYGYELLISKAQELKKKEPETIGNEILKTVQQFSGGKILDDYTLLVIRFL